jgi:hypothetical protein
MLLALRALWLLHLSGQPVGDLLLTRRFVIASKGLRHKAVLNLEVLVDRRRAGFLGRGPSSSR